MVPGIGKWLRPDLLKTQLWMKHLVRFRRKYGVMAFVLGLVHGVWIGVVKQLNFLEAKTWITYFQGITLLIIFTILAVTSNNWSVKRLKTKWKKIHSLTYLVLIFLPWHIFDKMFGHWSWITPFALVLIILTGLLFVIREVLEHHHSVSKS
jgi:methionine sulfoxide reductase heme-binding subunit